MMSHRLKSKIYRFYLCPGLTQQQMHLQTHNRIDYFLLLMSSAALPLRKDPA